MLRRSYIASTFSAIFGFTLILLSFITTFPNICLCTQRKKVFWMNKICYPLNQNIDLFEFLNKYSFHFDKLLFTSLCVFIFFEQYTFQRKIV